MSGMDADLAVAIGRSLGTGVVDALSGARRRRREGVRASTSPTAGACSPRPIPRRRRTSSRPRPPDCLAARRRPTAVAVPEVLAVSDDAAEPPRAGVDRGGRRAGRGSTEAELRRRARALHRGRRAVLRPRGSPDHGQPRAAERAAATRGPSSTPRTPAAARPPRARRGALAAGGAIAGLGARGGPPRRRSAAADEPPAPAARRPLGRQPPRRRRRPALADRPRRARRPPGVRPGDDAAVRRLRRASASTRTRTCRRSPPVGRTGSRCTRSRRSSCTRSSSAAATSARGRRRDRPLRVTATGPDRDGATSGARGSGGRARPDTDRAARNQHAGGEHRDDAERRAPIQTDPADAAHPAQHHDHDDHHAAAGATAARTRRVTRPAGVAAGSPPVRSGGGGVHHAQRRPQRVPSALPARDGPQARRAAAAEPSRRGDPVGGGAGRADRRVRGSARRRTLGRVRRVGDRVP